MGEHVALGLLSPRTSPPTWSRMLLRAPTPTLRAFGVPTYQCSSSSATPRRPCRQWLEALNVLLDGTSVGKASGLRVERQQRNCRWQPGSTTGAATRSRDFDTRRGYVARVDPLVARSPQTVRTVLGATITHSKGDCEPLAGRCMPWPWVSKSKGLWNV
jgi:hypothetical protein